jgi:hypothetical protein
VNPQVGSPRDQGARQNSTPNELDNGYVHAGSSQAPTIEKDLPNDGTGPSQAMNAPLQSPPSTILALALLSIYPIWALKKILQLNCLIHLQQINLCLWQSYRKQKT